MIFQNYTIDRVLLRSLRIYFLDFLSKMENPFKELSTEDNIMLIESLGHTLTRISLGVILLAHGLLKVFGFGIPGTIGFFASLGLPETIAYIVIFAEIIGGAALIIGAYTRLTSALSIPLLCGTVWAHLGNGWVHSSPGGGWEFPLLLSVLAVIVTLQGSGPFSASISIPIIDKMLPEYLKD